MKQRTLEMLDKTCWFGVRASKFFINACLSSMLVMVFTGVICTIFEVTEAAWYAKIQSILTYFTLGTLVGLIVSDLWCLVNQLLAIKNDYELKSLKDDNGDWKTI